MEMSTDYLSWYDSVNDSMYACDEFGNLHQIPFYLPSWYFQEH